MPETEKGNEKLIKTIVAVTMAISHCLLRIVYAIERGGPVENSLQKEVEKIYNLYLHKVS